MKSSGGNPFGLVRRAGAVVLLALATVAYGCGSSDPSAPLAQNPTGKGAAEILKPEQLYKYEGEGKAKRKVQISRHERLKLLHKASQTAN